MELISLPSSCETRIFYSRRDAQSLPSKLPPQNSPHQMAGQNSWLGGHRQRRHPSVYTFLQKAKFRWPAISPECLKIAATVYKTLSEQALGLAGAEETFQILPHAYGVPQRPGNQKTSNWESQAKGRPTWRRKVPTGATVRQKNDGPQQKHRSRKRAAQTCSTTHSCLMGSDWPHYLSFDSSPPVFSLRLWSSSTFERGTTLFSFWLFSLFVLINRLII